MTRAHNKERLNSIQFYYVWIDAHGLEWNKVVNSTWLQCNEMLFNGLLQKRLATHAEIKEFIDLEILQL